MRIWSRDIPNASASPLSERMDYDRSRDCWCAEWRPYNYPLFYGPSTGPPCDAPSLFSRGVPIKKTIGAFLGGPRVGSYSSPVPIHRVYNTLTGRSRSVRFLSSSLSLFTSPLPFLPLSFALHARRHNKSFRGTARPETDFVRSVRPRHPRETIDRRRDFESTMFSARREFVERLFDEPDGDSPRRKSQRSVAC